RKDLRPSGLTSANKLRRISASATIRLVVRANLGPVLRLSKKVGFLSQGPDKLPERAMSSNWFKSTGSVFDIAVVTLSACVGLVSLYFGLKTNNSSSKTLAVLIVLVCTEILVFRLGMLFQRRRSRLATPAPTPQSAERK